MKSWKTHNASHRWANYTKAGDLLQAVKEGFFHMDNIQADLHKLSMKGYQRPKDSITLFKSVGASIEDFVAARMVAEATR